MIDPLPKFSPKHLSAFVSLPLDQQYKASKPVTRTDQVGISATLSHCRILSTFKRRMF